MEDLKTTLELTKVIDSLNINCKLREKINNYILLEKNNIGISNLMFRGNLHYIIDNIDKVSLINELDKCNF